MVHVLGLRSEYRETDGECLDVVPVSHQETDDEYVAVAGKENRSSTKYFVVADSPNKYHLFFILYIYIMDSTLYTTRKYINTTTGVPLQL